MIVGILGAGQLARMMILAGLPMGLSFKTYSPDHKPSTSEMVEHRCGQYDDIEALRAFSSEVDVVTYEHENLSVLALESIESQITLRPNSRVIANLQDRLFEKQYFKRIAIPTNEFYAVDTLTDAYNAAAQLSYPFIIKTRRNGYDGKGQWRIQSEQDIQALKSIDLPPCIAESFVEFDREISIVAARDKNGIVQAYDVCENQHQSGVLHVTHNCIGDPSFEKSYAYAKLLMDDMEYVGVLAIEFFEKNRELFANEVAPRVHNSGHWTLEGAKTNQFENHVRAVCGLPLGSTDSVARVRMENCLGAMPPREKVLDNANSHYHDYIKKPRPGRKVGHITTFLK